RELERSMPEPMRMQAQRQRTMMDAQNMLNRQREELREKQEEEFRRKELAMTSQRGSQSTVAHACLEYLKKERSLPDDATNQSACEQVLYKMLFDEDFANRICKVLDGWRAWGE